MPAGLNEILQTTWPILLMVVIFYFLLYRPQKKQQKARENLLDSLKKGQQVITIGGVYGTINSLDAEHVKLQIAPNTEIKVTRNSISKVL